ncbi:hypothetical protein HJC23_013276 [Cyclotella cryptica]|uniref:Uncharacterized protein n=1 Tax=Cyclotella cryptica TaxID=29204 RepID=A0ABD3P8C5_9STRA|eukprot:CCRYP_016914-RA/>CCRYP_016914-RA protein AED:0.31 eAED:0.31 QI:0/-1/0/1/-1/1/1/0/218
MKRPLGLKRSFNYEDLASIVHSSLPTKRAKRLRTHCSSESSATCSLVDGDDVARENFDSHKRFYSTARLISPTSSTNHVTITPDSSPTVPFMVTERHTSNFSLATDNFECPATAALNRVLAQRTSSSSTDWDSAVFPLQEGEQKSKCNCTAWPAMVGQYPSPRARHISITPRTCSARTDDQESNHVEADADVRKLQTAFSLLSFPHYKLEPKKSRLSF